jgi:hypothetical protein
MVLGEQREAVEEPIDRRQPLPAARLLLIDDAREAMLERARNALTGRFSYLSSVS